MTSPPDTASSETTPRRDPALSLLDQIMRDALDSGYAEAAARPHRPRSGTAILAVALGLLTFAVVAVVLETRQEAPGAAEARSALVERIDEATATTDALESDVAELTADVEAIRTRALESLGAGEGLAARLTALGVAAGTLAVTGPGVEVVLDDAADGDVPPDVDEELTRVLDRDLQLVVNGLWAAGAEAVSVNGQRLTSLSAIRSAGDAILVNYRPLVRPYVVRAIGNPGTLAVDFTDGAAGRTLRTLQQTYGIQFEVDDVDDLELPGASVGTLDYVELEED